jgi:hypothetical protein
MKLPNGDRAIVDIRKLVGCSLDTRHERGGDKAKMFASALGMTVDDADELRQLLLLAAATGEAEATEMTRHGQLFVLDFDVARGPWAARVRSGWIVRFGEDVPRLTTCFVRRRG